VNKQWAAEADIYTRLGVTRIINAAGTYTAVGGSLMPESVMEAMRIAGSAFVDMQELHTLAGQRLAELTNNEAAYVTSGCAAAIVLAVLACITRGDPAAIARMPQGEGLPTEIIMHTAHRNPYDPSIRLGGGRIVNIGNTSQTFEWELEAAITPNTAAVFYPAGPRYVGSVLPLETVTLVAHKHGIPVIVDAAADLPPHTNLWHFTRDCGADLALFSGGKGLRGPQASGMMVGSPELIAAARANGSPHQRLARSLKVGKEEVAGLVRAVELYVGREHQIESASWERIVANWVEGLSDCPGVSVRRQFPNNLGRPIPQLLLEVNADVPTSATEIADELWASTPRIMVLRRGGPRMFYLSPETVTPDEAAIVAGQIRKAVKKQIG
jgi:L-seryl-tRNA(Ser) seleniumtransferase